MRPGRLSLADTSRMDLSHVRGLYDALSGDRLSFGYSGLFHDEHTSRLITLGEEHLEREGAERSMKGKLAFVMVEAYQNIVRHRAPVPEGALQGKARSVFLFRSRAGQYEVTAINPVVESDAGRVAANVDRLGAMDMQQLKQVFLRGLQSEERTERGGAGLGLIEMARRSGNPLRYGFAELDQEHRLFLLQVALGRATPWSGGTATGFALHGIMAQEGIAVFYRGSLTAGEQEVVLRIIERDLDEEQGHADARTRAFLAVTELLPALGPADEGPLVVLGKARHAATAGAVSLVVAVPLSEAAADLFKNAVAKVNAMDPSARQRRYRDMLLGRGDAVNTVELGLIDLAKRSTGPLRLEEFRWKKTSLVVLEAMI